MNWRYFGKSAGTGRIRFVFRIPAQMFEADHERFTFEQFEVMERYFPGGQWLKGYSEQAERDWMHGWFDESDEISEEEMLLITRGLRESDYL